MCSSDLSILFYHFRPVIPEEIHQTDSYNKHDRQCHENCYSDDSFLVVYMRIVEYFTPTRIEVFDQILSIIKFPQSTRNIAVLRFIIQTSFCVPLIISGAFIYEFIFIFRNLIHADNFPLLIDFSCEFGVTRYQYYIFSMYCYAVIFIGYLVI